MLKGIRGAIDVEKNEEEIVYGATRELLTEIMRVNNISQNNIISAFFSATRDLTAAYPAKAARDLGWTEVPMMCLQEMYVEGSLPQCIRILLHVDWVDNRPVQHVYLGRAKALRPDWLKNQ